MRHYAVDDCDDDNHDNDDKLKLLNYTFFFVGTSVYQSINKILIQDTWHYTQTGAHLITTALMLMCIGENNCDLWRSREHRWKNEKQQQTTRRHKHYRAESSGQARGKKGE